MPTNNPQLIRIPFDQKGRDAVDVLNVLCVFTTIPIASGNLNSESAFAFELKKAREEWLRIRVNMSTE